MRAVRRDQLTILFYGLAGGFGDATSFLCYRTFTGHVTGNLVLMMVSLSQSQWFECLTRLLAIALFLIATWTGYRLGERPAAKTLLFTAQAFLLCTLVEVMHRAGANTLIGVAAFSLALGLQNGVVTALHNVSFHSTFVSGDFTKLLKPMRTEPDTRSAAEPTRMLRLLITGFAIGALIASLLHRTHPSASVPALLAALGLAFCSTLLPVGKFQADTAVPSHSE